MRALITEDHPLFVDGFQAVLQRLQPDMTISQAACAEEALRLLDANEHFDLIVIDLKLPGMDGITLLEAMRTRGLWIPTVVMSADVDIKKIQLALENGALGFLPKSYSAEQLLAALREVLAGHIHVPSDIRLAVRRAKNDSHDLPDAASRYGITTRQYRVLELVAEGCSNGQIAAALNVTEHTVKSHVRALFQALDTANRTACVRRAESVGLLGSAQASSKS